MVLVSTVLISALVAMGMTLSWGSRGATSFPSLSKTKDFQSVLDAKLSGVSVSSVDEDSSAPHSSALDYLSTDELLSEKQWFRNKAKIDRIKAIKRQQNENQQPKKEEKKKKGFSALISSFLGFLTKKAFWLFFGLCLLLYKVLKGKK